MMVMAMVTARRTIEWLCGPRARHKYSFRRSNTPWFVPTSVLSRHRGSQNRASGVKTAKKTPISPCSNLGFSRFPDPRVLSVSLRLSPSLSVSLRLSPR